MYLRSRFVRWIARMIGLEIEVRQTFFKKGIKA
jgi:hypothetical protein